MQARLPWLGWAALAGLGWALRKWQFWLLYVLLRCCSLTTSQKLACRPTAACRKALGNLLAAGVADPAQEVHDKALMYYR